MSLYVALFTDEGEVAYDGYERQDSGTNSARDSYVNRKRIRFPETPCYCKPFRVVATALMSARIGGFPVIGWRTDRAIDVGPHYIPEFAPGAFVLERLK